MPELKVFISSTYEDLKSYRKEITDFFQTGLPDTIIKGMESMPASDKRPIDMCRRKVEESNVFILVIGKRYGWIPDDPQNPDKLSITELEYEWARQHYANNPNSANIILCFVADRSIELAGDIETDPQLQEEKSNKLIKFIKKVQSQAGIVPTIGFATPDDLRNQISKALWDKYIPKNKQTVSGIVPNAYLNCNRDDNYFKFKRSILTNGDCKFFLAAGESEAQLDNFFERLVIFEYQGSEKLIKELPARPDHTDAEKNFREHIENIALEIDPCKNSLSITSALQNYKQCQASTSNYCSSIYFKTYISTIEVDELADHLNHLKRVYQAVKTEAENSGVDFFIFIYTHKEEIEQKLSTDGYTSLGRFKRVNRQDIEKWLSANLSADSGVKDDIIEKFVVEFGDDPDDFQYTMKRTEKKLREIIKLYNSNDQQLMQYIL